MNSLLAPMYPSFDDSVSTIGTVVSSCSLDGARVVVESYEGEVEYPRVVKLSEVNSSKCWTHEIESE